MTMSVSARRRPLSTVLWVLFLAALSPAATGQYVQQGSKLVGTGSVTGPILNGVEQGYAVSISSDGNTAVIGGPNDNDFVGASWVFTRSAGVFSQQGPKLVGTGFVAAGHQGFSVAISGDGNTIAMTNPGDAGNVGAVWIFTRSGGVWTQEGSKLVGTGATGFLGAQLGYSVAISGDGNTVLAGGPSDASDLGAAWVFTRSAGVWSQQGSKLVGSGATGSAQQGVSVSLSTDGNTAVVGGDHDNSSAGAAWVFTRSGATWTQQGAKLVGTGASGAIVQQGHAVAVSGDGNTAMVGGWVDNANVGAVWVFVRSAGSWSQQGTKLVGTGAVNTALQGTSVSVSADGNTAFVGGHDDGATGLGATWVFTRSGGVWSQLGSKLVGSGGVFSGQGQSVAISSDASTAIVGGPSDVSQMGAAWIFTAGPAAAPPAISKAFGAASIALNGTTSLTFTLQNNNASALTGVGFTDTLPAGLAVSSPNGLTGSCGGGAITAIAGSGSVNLSGATLAGAASCTFRVNVTGTTLGIKNNVTGAVTSVESGSGGTASASVTVAAVTSFTGPTATGSGNATVSFTGGGAACQFTSAAFIPLVGGASSPPAGSAPAGVAFPHGLLDFATGGCTPGATLNFTVVYPQPLAPGTVYWKYGPTLAVPAPHWYTIPAIVAGNTLTFSITDGGLGDDDLAANGVIVDVGGAGAPAAGASFYPLPPCRVGDTRRPNGPLDGPALQPGATRSFAPAGVCGIPSGAVAISVNLTVTNVGAAGELVVFPSDVAKPNASSVSFAAGRTRANNDVVVLSGSGTSFSVFNNSAASVDFILDVNGYFQ